MNICIQRSSRFTLDDILLAISKSKTIVNDFFFNDFKFMETTLGDEMPTCDSKTECGMGTLHLTTKGRYRHFL